MADESKDTQVKGQWTGRPGTGRPGIRRPTVARPGPRWRGPLTVVGSALALFWPGALAFGLPGVQGEYWQEAFDVGSGAVGSIMFFMLASLGIFMSLVGRWQERLGLRTTMTIGVIMCGLSVLILPFASGMYMVYGWAFIVGTSSCFTNMPALTVVQRWYPARRGLVSGIVNLVFGSAAAVMSPFFALMLVGLGYGSMNLAIAVLALVIGVAATRLVFVPEDHPPADLGQPPAHTGQPDAALESIPTEAVAGVPGGNGVFGRSLTVREGLRHKNFWLIWMVWALQGAAGIAMVPFAVGFGISKGFSLETAVIILVAFNLTNGLGRMLSGYLSDMIARSLMMAATFFAAGVAYMLLPHVGTLALISVLAALVGFAFGTLFSVSAPLAVDCFGIAHFGAIYGLIFTAYGFLAGLLGPLLGGLLVDAGNGYTVVFTYLGTLSLIAAILMLFVRPTQDRCRSVAARHSGDPPSSSSTTSRSWKAGPDNMEPSGRKRAP